MSRLIYYPEKRMGTLACTFFRCVFYYSFVFAAEGLAGQVTKENCEQGLIYPPFTNIRKISAHIAANVAAKVYELGEKPFLPV